MFLYTLSITSVSDALYPQKHYITYDVTICDSPTCNDLYIYIYSDDESSVEINNDGQMETLRISLQIYKLYNTL